MTEKIVNEKNCSGCYACVNACPKDAIVIKPNSFQSNKAIIDQYKCISCGLCEQICPSINPIKLYKAHFCYAAWSKNEEDLQKSSSGGIAAVLSRDFLNNKGIVYGSVSENRNIFHKRMESLSECDALRGSKYVESSIGLCYRTIKQDLLNKKNVLFIGTPCQVAGLKSFLRNDYNELLTVDLICHGTPLFVCLENYVNSILPKKQRSKWDTISFRRNNTYELSIMESDKILYRRKSNRDAYLSAFLSDMILQQSCYSCKFAAPERVGDITIGDFWGLDREKIPQDYLGKVSVVLPNSPKGESVMASLEDELTMIKLPVEDALHPAQGNLLHPSVPHIERAKFLDLSPKIGIKKAIMSTEVGARIKKQENEERHQRSQDRKDFLSHFPNHVLIRLLGDEKYTKLKQKLRG